MDGRVLGSAEEDAPMRASGACTSALLRLLAEGGHSLREVEGYAADLGPGSFTGVRVGVTLAKTLAWAHGKKAAGLSSFDLIDPASTVAVPSKKGEWFIRQPGRDPVRKSDLPGGVLGYGFPDGHTFPAAARFGAQLHNLAWQEAEGLMPLYLIEPSISKPKVAFA